MGYPAAATSRSIKLTPQSWQTNARLDTQRLLNGPQAIGLAEMALNDHGSINTVRLNTGCPSLQQLVAGP